MELLRPFFSIIIPCYNSKDTIGRLLLSIVNQHMLYSDIEVILSDDCSTQSYEAEIAPFKKSLNIKQVKTDYNCCPGNTRQRGVDAATGRWIIFSDHDDEFVSDTFPIVKREILKNNCDTVYETRFVKVHTNGQIQQMQAHMGWTHGRFFNLDNFWKKYNIHYIKDLTSHEDISISTQMNVIYSNHPELITMEGNIVTYRWYEKTDSLSNRGYIDQNGVDRPFLDLFYIDYLTSTAGVYKKAVDENRVSDEFALGQLREVMLYAYFYMEYNINEVPNYLKRNYDQARMYLHFMNDRLNYSIDQLYEFYKHQNKIQYADIFQKGLIATGFIVYEHTFKQWLQLVYNGNY